MVGNGTEKEQRPDIAGVVQTPPHTHSLSVFIDLMELCQAVCEVFL